MNTITLLCIIGGGVVLLLIIAIIIIRKVNKKRFNKLQENLKKYKEENKEFEHNAKITLSKDEEPNDLHNENVEDVVKVKEPSAEPIIEDYIDDENERIPSSNKKTRTIKSDEDFAKFLSEYNFKDNNIQKNHSSRSQSNEDDFEDFLNEHAYSRSILNKDIMKKLKDLPPEIKAVILSNVFNKYDDN